jgi:soluble lytic murein transglycosylase-like protein
MAALRLGTIVLLAAAVPAAAQATADPVARWRSYSAEASQRFGIPLVWIERVMRAESGGRTQIDGRPITSRAGAMGLMQLMPGTWADMRARLDLGDDPYDPHDNILAGAAYLRLLYQRFGYPGLFAAYNAGPGRYAAYLAGRQPLPAETRSYLRQLASRSSSSPATGTLPKSRPSLFAIRVADESRTAPPATRLKGLFAIRIER